MNSKKKIFILLGRTGDVLNLLPAIEYEGKINNYIPKVVVAKEYADVLDGCSYVEKVVFDGDFRNINEALRFVKINYSTYKVVNCTVYGKNYSVEKLCSSFTREIWRLSGCPIPQNMLALTFDKAERQTVSLANNKPIILLTLKGTSSPLSNEVKFANFIKEYLGNEFNVIDLSNVRYHKIYDMIALFSIAHVLIAIDSAPLHLANAVPTLPVISLISDNKESWYQSAWRPNHIMRVLYSEIENKMGTIIEAARTGKAVPKREIYFVTSSARGIEIETKRRMDLALSSRLLETNNVKIKYTCFNYQDYERKSTEGMPYVKDMIDFISGKAEDDDILMICNADVCFIPGITGKIIHAIDRNDSAYFHRWDMRPGKIRKLLVSEAELKGYKWYDGSDAFVFTKRWWIANREIFPDMVFGREYWDCIFRNVIKRSEGVEIHKAIYHEKHNGYWEINKKDNQGNQENTILALEWFREFGGKTADWKYKPEEWKQVYKKEIPANADN